MMAGLRQLLHSFFGSPLGRRVLALSFSSLAMALGLFAILHFTMVRARTTADMAAAASEISAMLVAAMTADGKGHDLTLMKAIVDALAQADGMATLALLNADGIVRYTSMKGSAGRSFATDSGGIVVGTVLVMDPIEGEVVRTVTAVPNDGRCATCHHSAAAQPVIGYIVVDHKAEAMRQRAWQGTLSFSGAITTAGLIATIFAVLLIRHTVLIPVQTLAETTDRFAAGDLSQRVVMDGNHELAVLGRRFNAMADRVGGAFNAVQTSESFLKTVLDAIPDGARVIGDDFRVVTTNAAFDRLHGLAPGAAVGRSCHALSHGLAEPCPPTMVVCPVVALRHQGEALKCHYRHVGAAGEETFFEVTAARVETETPDGRRGLTIELFRDLAGAAAVSQEQRLAEIGLLATGIAHEIHNPLASVRLALKAMHEDLGPQVESYLDTVDREIERCMEVTRRLLHISDPGASEPVLVEVADVAADIAALLRPEAERSGVELKLTIDGKPRLLGSEGDVGILVLNLAQNAIHAMPTGGRLDLKVADRGRVIEVTVADTGIGIAREDLARIFWPFWSRRADGKPGTGLGLSICKATAERLGGTIAVDSSVGIGTSFTVTLPSADAEVAA